LVAVGDSVTPLGVRGLAVAVDLANHVQFERRLGGNSATSFAAVVADGSGVRVAATSQLGHADLVRLDELGNISKQTKVFTGAEAQALLATGDGGALLLATETWTAGGSVRLARLAADDTVLWQTVITPATPDQVARAASMVVTAAGLVVAGQDHGYAAPEQTQPWWAQIGLSDGQLLGQASLDSLPTSAQILAVAADSGQLWWAGEGLGGGGGWLARAPLDSVGLPGAATVVAATLVAATPVGGSWRGLAGLGDGVVAAGWVVQADLDAGLWRAGPGGVLWSQVKSLKGKQVFHGVAVLADGTVVAVGGRDTATGGQGFWLRVGALGAGGCE